MTKKKRHLSEDDKSLWKRITQKVKPLSREKKRTPPEPSSPYRPLQKKPAFSIPPIEENFVREAKASSRKIQRVKRVTIDARLDLHGYTLENARLQLTKFLIRAQENRCLWVLVITGKGKPKSLSKEDYDTPKKTLRDQLPLWLEEPHLQSVVSAYTPAKPQDGGTGAFYVRLKRLITHP